MVDDRRTIKTDTNTLISDDSQFQLSRLNHLESVFFDRSRRGFPSIYCQNPHSTGNKRTLTTAESFSETNKWPLKHTIISLKNTARTYFLRISSPVFSPSQEDYKRWHYKGRASKVKLSARTHRPQAQCWHTRLQATWAWEIQISAGEGGLAANQGTRNISLANHGTARRSRDIYYVGLGVQKFECFGKWRWSAECSLLE